MSDRKWHGSAARAAILLTLFAACGGSDDEAPEGSGGSGAGGSGAKVGQAGSGGRTAGKGGSAAGNGGSTEQPGGAGGSGGTAAGGSGGTGGGGQAGSSAGNGGSQGGAAGFSSSVKSNVPGLAIEYAGNAGPLASLRFVSAKLIHDQPLRDVFEQFFAEIVNESTSTFCLLKVDAEFQTSDGRILANPEAYADAPPYKNGDSKLTFSCLGPGDRGVLWTIDTVPTKPDLTLARKLRWKAEFLPPGDAVPHPNVPKLELGSVSDKFGSGNYWTLRGVVTAKGTIHNVGLSIYPIGSDGLVLDSLSATSLETLFGGTSWNFESSGADERFSSQLVFPDWLEGPKTAFARTADTVTPLQLRHAQARSFADLRAERARALHDERVAVRGRMLR